MVIAIMETVKMKRKSWDAYFMEIADRVKDRSTCPRRQVGALVVKDKRIKGTGYNGSPPGLPHCTEVGCYEVSGRCKRTIHAEINAILECTPDQRSGATIYITDQPCFECTKVIIASGISRVLYRNPYDNDVDLFLEAPHIEVIKWEDKDESN